MADCLRQVIAVHTIHKNIFKYLIRLAAENPTPCQAMDTSCRIKYLQYFVIFRQHRIYPSFSLRKITLNKLIARRRYKDSTQIFTISFTVYYKAMFSNCLETVAHVA